MDIGMMWFDNDMKAGLPARVERAATYYQKKYGVPPNVCFVNPQTAKEGRCGGVQVRHSDSLLPNHFWIGVEK